MGRRLPVAGEPPRLRTFAGATALVTGAGSGIGEALSKALAARGARVVVTDRRGEEAARVAAAIRAASGDAEHETLDVRDAVAFGSVVERVFSSHGRLDYLFNNAGIAVAGEVIDFSLQDWRDILDVNVLGVVHGVHAAYPRMVRQGFGHLVNTASMAGLMPAPFVSAYGMSKHAVVGLSRSLRAEAARYGVRVSALCPGIVRTPIADGGAFGRYLRRPSPEFLEYLMRRLHAMAPDVFAPKVLDQVARNRGRIIVPWWWRAADWVNRAAPVLGDWLGERAFAAIKSELDKGSRPPADTSED
ncbi:MAG: SDR family NAD(P)-dependent oxidoreductase [Vicinamibacteria bacterium]